MFFCLLRLGVKSFDFSKRDGSTNIFSYVQIRGSSGSSFFFSPPLYLICLDPLVPLFWTQTGYGLKPPPLVSPDRTREQHMSAMKRHFEGSVTRYGPHVSGLFFNCIGYFDS